MSWVKIVHITCDSCFDWFNDEVYTKVSQAKDAAKKEGWIFVGKKIYCPKCKKDVHRHALIKGRWQLSI